LLYNLKNSLYLFSVARALPDALTISPAGKTTIMKPQKIVHLFSLILLYSILAFPLHSQQNDCLPPVALPKPTEPNIFSDEQEVYLGEAVAEHMQKNYRVIDDAKVTAYLTEIGERLSKHLPPTEMRLKFFLVDLHNANAFILPGGRIYVSRKLVAYAQSEDELAGVIAHELGHLVARESAINTTRLFKEVLGVTQVTGRRDVFEKYNQLIDNFGRKPEVVKKRDREEGQMVADQIGFYALVSAGYDPTAQARFWERMTETKGKTGSWFSDLFGTTKPEERRLREMLKVVSAMPAACIKARASAQSETFKQWQSAVVSYANLSRREALHGVLSQKQLSPPLRSDITHLRFSPDGKYLLAQDDSGINVLTREPFAPLFRIEAHDANPASFTPDSQKIVFHTDNLRVESWNVAEAKLIDAREVVVRKGCLQTALAPDGKILACLSAEFDLHLLDVASSQTVIHRKEFFAPGNYLVTLLIALLSIINEDGGDLDDLGLLNMGFSPDGRYFAAGYSGNAEAYELSTLKKLPLSGSIKKFIEGGFAFLDNNRLVGVNDNNSDKSALVQFPSGQVISEFSLWRRGLTAPTRGDYVLIRPIKDYALGVMNLSDGKIFKVNERPALDIFGDIFVAEMRNGQLGLYRMEKNVVVATTLLPNFTLGRLHVAELSPDMKWLALSTRSRGGVWNLQSGQAALYLRGFRGGHFNGDGYFYGDFPKYETMERNVAKFNLANGEIVPGAKIEGRNVRQIGQYLIVTKPAKEKLNKDEPVQYGRNVIVEMLDARTMQSLWAKVFPKEAPRVWVAQAHGTIALRWDVTSDAAQYEIKNDPALKQRLLAMNEKKGDYLIQILDLKNGTQLGQLLIETGKGSFRLSNVFAAGDWVIVTDTQNRVLVYSLSTGELKGRVFGGFATVAQAKGLLCVENESGQLTIYSLKTMEKQGQFDFANPVSLVRFSEDGGKLFVMTDNQTAYVLDTSSMANAASAVK
jgi:WD40 repeat protein